MEISAKVQGVSESEGIIISLFEDNLELNIPKIDNMIRHLKKNDKFSGKDGEIYTFTQEIEGSIEDVVLLGLGKEKDVTLESIKVNLSKAYRKMKELKNNDITVKMIETENLDANEIAKAMTITLMLSDYEFNKYKSDKKDK